MFLTRPTDLESDSTLLLPALIPSVALSKRCPPFQTYFKELRELIYRLFGEELKYPSLLPQTLPLVKWQECQEIPGIFPLYLLCEASREAEIQQFFNEMISHWLVPDEDSHILSARNLTFTIAENGAKAFFFSELLVQVEKAKSIPMIERSLPFLIQEIKIGILSTSHARHILQMRGLSKSQKISLIHENFLLLLKRFSREIKPDIFEEVQRFLLHSREEFLSLRGVKHICKMIYLFYSFRKKLQSEVKFVPEKRHLFLKLMSSSLHFPFGLKTVLGLVIGVNFTREHECFELRHILKAIQRFLPLVKAVPDSFSSYHESSDAVRILYLEVEKSGREHFTLEEIKKLKAELPDELKNSIEQLTPSLFMPRNEEELYRSILTLSQELRYVKDLPQVMISFQEQTDRFLKFHVVVLRLLHQDSLPLKTLAQHLPQGARFVPERDMEVGMLRKKYLKQANLFGLEIEREPFLRKDHSVDLSRAREFVVSALENLLGEFRDYNGGLLLKQNEQLKEVKALLGLMAKKHDFLIDTLFYAITPSAMQSCLHPHTLQTLFTLILNMRETPLTKKDDYILKLHQQHEALFCIAAAHHPSFKDEATRAIEILNIDPLSLASSYVTVNGTSYLCYLYLRPSPDQEKAFASVLEKALMSWSQRQRGSQTLRIHLPFTAPSLDPRIATDRTSGIVIKMLYEGLMRIGKNGSLELAAAERLSISPDRKIYTFKLRDSKWSNGFALTAYDFEYAWKKALDPHFRDYYAFLFDPIKNAQAVKENLLSIDEVGVHATDETTLVVELEYPTPYFLELTALWIYSPLCKEVDRHQPGWSYYGGDAYVCNGPFKLAQWRPNQELHLIKNPLYWDHANVQLNRIEISIFEDPQTALEMFQRDELDWVGDPLWELPLRSLPHLRKQGTLHDRSIAGLFWLVLNVEQFPFNSAKMRRAFAYAINRQSIVNDVLQGGEQPAMSLLPPSMAVQTSPYFEDGNIALAQQIFEEALQELKTSRDQLPVIQFIHDAHDEHHAILSNIGKQLEAAFGIKVAFQSMNWNQYLEHLRQHEFLIAGSSWFCWYNDPSYYFDKFKSRTSPTNFSQWENNLFSHLLEKAKHLLDSESRKKYFQQAEALLLQEMPIIPIYFYKFRYIKNQYLQGVCLSDAGQIDFKWAHFDNP